MTTTKKAAKVVQVLATYVFKKVTRICFTVKSSNGADKYNTCFDGSVDKASCTCPSHVECYHIKQLRPVAQAYFDKVAAKTAATKPAYNIVSEAEETAAAYYRMSFSTY